MALHGSLTDISLPDVIQLVSVSGKTGGFPLSSEGIDGQLSIKQLEEVTGLPAFDVCKVLYGLVTSGLLSMRAVDNGKEIPAQGPPLTPSPQTAEQKPAQGQSAGLSLRSLFALAD